MDDLLKLVAARNVATAEGLVEGAREELAEVFGDGWGFDFDIVEYTEANLKNLWRTEMRRPVVHALEAGGVSREAYGEWLQEVYYVNVAIYLEALFPVYKKNAGWRVTVLGLPAVDVVAFGIASNYQSGQSHNRLATGCNVLYRIARDGLEAQGVPLPGREVLRADWDKDGLLPEVISDVAGVDIAEATDGTGLWLQEVRNTTIKKTIASFVSIEPFSGSGAAAAQALSDIELAARALAS
jgi:hypothetical protein